MKALTQEEMRNLEGGMRLAWKCGAGIISGGLTGMLVGGGAGSMIPGLGTLGGAAIGAVAGMVGGAINYC